MAKAQKINWQLWRGLTLLTTCVLFLSTPAHAVCSNNEDGQPGQDGEMEYFTATDTLMYCDDTNWIEMHEACGGAQTACGGNPDERAVFITPNAYAHDIRAGGLFGMDNHCTREAFLSGMSGVFYAWAADTNAANDPVNRFEQASVPYVKPDGVKVADDWSDLVDCTGSCLDSSINVTANGTTPGGGIPSVASNVDTAGAGISRVTTTNCNGWTQLTGSPNIGNRTSTSSTWTNNGTSAACNNGMFHYCFEQQGNDKVTLLGHTQVSQSPETDDVRELTAWGSYAYIISDDDRSISSIDISDPTTSISVTDTYVDTTNMITPRGIAVDGNYAYIASAGSDSLTIVDISDPTTLVAPSGGAGGVLTDGTDLNGAYGVAVQGNYAYVVGATMNQLTIVDVSDKTTPVIAGGGSGTLAITGASKIDVFGNYAYVISQANDRLTIVDVSDPTAPVVAGSGSGVLTDSTNLISPRYVKVQGNYAYVTAGGSNSLVVIDVSDPTAPVIANSGAAKVVENFYLGGAQGLVVDGDFAYTTGLTNRTVGAVDITDPLNPFMTASDYNNAVYASNQLSLAKSGKFLIVTVPTYDRIDAYEVVSNYIIGNACTNAGEYYYDSTDKKIVWCNGTNLVPMDFTGGGTGGCTSPTANEGAMDYDSTNNVYRFCDGDGWINIGK